MSTVQQVKFKRKTSAEIEELEVEDGSLIYDVETGKTYMDYGEDRIPTGGGGSGSSDIIIIGDETEATEDTKVIIEDEDLDFQPEEIVNEESNSTQKGYSAKYTNDRNTYSTNEVFTGKYWIDGKKIYRKVITETCSGGTTISINHNISNLNEVISLEYFTFNNTNKNTDIPHNGVNTLSINRITTTTINGSISTGYDSGWQIKIILEYTKESE